MQQGLPSQERMWGDLSLDSHLCCSCFLCPFGVEANRLLSVLVPKPHLGYDVGTFVPFYGTSHLIIK
jgi:hypothetical protein